ncbi:alkaline phosphatase family protein [Lutibacter flavus]|uniref:Phospholipase C n=1 Tax=Lutibacter flavus TaxID=691689 RepID=A0A238VMT3_9FLAO|nr:alkaline phosphatase family protein [Lutibacter flavus]SNR35474.1 phospholipase C [Lutibacter flavus]
MKNKLDCFDHVVVLMLENRSFDNILGYASEKFDGVIGKNLSNPSPTRTDGKRVHGDGEPIKVRPGTTMDNPNPDPGEYFPHINTQLYNCVHPSKNAFSTKQKHFKPPYNQPVTGTPKSVACSELPYPAPMTGFVQDYYNKIDSNMGIFHTPHSDEYSIIMECFAAEKVPVMSGLAKSFAVFDRWHCAVPSQTFCNRSFFNAATSNGQVVNTKYTKWLEKDFNRDTIFNRLEEQGKPWVIYYDKMDVFPLTLLIHFQKLWPFFKEKKQRKLHFRHMEDFHKDVENGDLPAYSFIEPRLFFNHNDMHPPIKILGITQPSSVTAGEDLVNEVYTVIKKSNSQKPTGSNSENTLLCITYDEHGGCYDHVSPPKCATPPNDGSINEMGFPFDRLGIRVPTIMISAWSDPQVINSQKQHTSMLKTLGMKWDFEHLTDRDASAPDFLEIFNRTSPLPGTEWPCFNSIDNPKGSKDNDNYHYPLNDLQKAVLGMAHELAKDLANVGALKKEIKIGESLEHMKKILNSFDNQ